MVKLKQKIYLKKTFEKKPRLVVLTCILQDVRWIHLKRHFRNATG